MRLSQLWIAREQHTSSAVSQGSCKLPPKLPLRALCMPAAAVRFQQLHTHATAWDPETVQITVNARLDARIVPSPSCQAGARVDYAHVAVLDDFFEESHRVELLDMLTAPTCDHTQVCLALALVWTVGKSSGLIMPICADAASCSPSRAQCSGATLPEAGNTELVPPIFCLWDVLLLPDALPVQPPTTDLHACICTHRPLLLQQH